MKKLMLIATILAVTLLAAVPAIAQVGQETELEGESGDVDQTFEISSEGDNGSSCVGVSAPANSGNAQNVTSLIQYDSDADDFEFEEVGGNITVESPSETTCDQQVNQAAAAG